MTDTVKPPAVAEGSTALPGHPEGVGGMTVPESVKSILPTGAFRTDDHRYYFNAQGPFPGVTSIIDVLMKWDLVNWKQRSAAQAVLDMLTDTSDVQVRAIPDEEIVKLAISRADEKRDSAARIGSGVHLLADLQVREEAGIPLEASEKASKPSVIPEEWIPYLEAYRAFLGRYSASSIVSSEKMIWSLNGYGGTYDLIMLIDGELWLIDIKTSKGYYPEYGLQLAAYRWADGIILPGDPRLYAMPEIQHTAVLHLRPDLYRDTGWRLIEYPTDYMQDYMSFLGVLEAYKWRSKKRFSRSDLKPVTGS